MVGNQNEMSFWDHLEVMRWALVRIIIVLLVAFIASFCFTPWLFEKIILAPTSSDFFLYKYLELLPNFSKSEFHVDIININVASQFLTHVSTSFWIALLIVFPYLVFEIWRFISPALYENEKTKALFGFTFGTVMFYLGCLLGYSVVFPFTFRFLAEYQVSTDIVNQISLNSYMSTFLGMIFIMGLTFELPLISIILSLMGLLNKEFLKSYRRYAVVVLLVLAAVITPTGDPFTLTVVFLPLYLLYELSILLMPKTKN